MIGFCDLFRKNLLKREKTARIIQKAAYKNRQHDFFRLPVLGMFEPSKTFFMFLFVMPVNQNANAAQLRLKSEKSTRINQKTAQKQAARFLSPACFDMFEPSKALFMFLFVMPVNQNANAAQLRLRCQNRQESIRKLHKKQAARFLSPACLGMFEPSKAFSMFLFMMPANQAASHCNQNQNANDQRCHLPVAFP